jgi:beta-glucosidase/6-phospho-beta-glucosidase/beta-galactosidase
LGPFQLKLHDFDRCEGYVPRFGVTYVDRVNPGFKRYPKQSAFFLKDFFDKAVAR